jgi:hypothetical protein
MKRIFFAWIGALSTAVVCAPAIAQTCPLEGDAKQQLAREFNPLKNRELAPTPADFDPSATLATVLAPGEDLNRRSHDKAAIFEGYVVGVKMGGIESVNCHAKDPPHRDTHIELALSPSAKPTERVIVEVTPRWRDKIKAVADWSTASLKKDLMPPGVPQRVRVTGWLFDDLEHSPQAENTNPGGKGNWRATVWEIHPITGIELLSGSSVIAGGRSAVSHHPVKRKRSCARGKRGLCRKTAHKRTHLSV